MPLLRLSPPARDFSAPVHPAVTAPAAFAPAGAGCFDLPIGPGFGRTFRLPRGQRPRLQGALGAVLPGVALLWAGLTTAVHAVDVRTFGAKGDGVADDTAAITAAIRGATDGVVEFPRGRYRLTRPIEVPLAEHGTLGLVGRGGSATVLMAGPGPAFRFTGSHATGTADPKSVQPVTWAKERMPSVDGLEIVGEHPEADGIEFRNTLMAVVRAVLIRDVRHGLHFTSRNRNVLIDAAHVYHCHGSGVFLDTVNIHQMIIGDSHISYCQQGGIKVLASEIRNFQITGNDIEYNFAPGGPPVADIWFDLAGKGSVREGTISGNTIQALQSPGGANIRFTGIAGNPRKVGVWSITGNHIANQETSIHLQDASGITISGNTFMRGFERLLVLERSRNIIVSGNVFDHNEDYFTATTKSTGGLVVDRSSAVIISDNIIDGVEAGAAEAGGALAITDSRQVTVTGNQLLNPKFRGLHIARSADVRVSDNLVHEDAGRERMLAAITLEGPCPGTVVSGNTLGAGRNGRVVNHATGATISERPE